MKKLIKIILFSAFFMSFEAGAQSTPYRVSAILKSEMRFEVPYTLGTHRGVSNVVTGTIQFDLAAGRFTQGQFRVPIHTLTTGSEQRDCHLQESLGIHYANSEFPKEHVCKNNVLPTTGGNAVVYPEVLLTVVSAVPAQPDPAVILTVAAEWTIHGVTRPAQFTATRTSVGKALRIRGVTQVSLKDFGIIVKSANIFIATISVQDTVQVIFDLAIEPVE